MTKLICFGDSWAYGAELNTPQVIEHPFIHWVADDLKLPYENHGVQGSPLGLIVHQIVSNIKNINKQDIVLVIVPPDTRWYDENEDEGFHPLMTWRIDDYAKSINKKTLEWFRYHHALFVYSIQKIMQDIGCYYIMAHNYGQIDDIFCYNLNIDVNRFLSKIDLTNLLSEVPHTWRSYPNHAKPEHRYDEDGPLYNHEFSGKYFKGCVNHPNELGHKKIAELFLDKIKSEHFKI